MLQPDYVSVVSEFFVTEDSVSLCRLRGSTSQQRDVIAEARLVDEAETDPEIMRRVRLHYVYMSE